MSDLSWILPVLIVTPIVAAAFPLLLGRLWSNVGWWIAAAIGLLQTSMAVILLRRVLATGSINHELGGFSRPIGIELVADELSVWFVTLIAITFLIVLAITRSSGPRGNAFSSVYLLLMGGLLGVSLTGDLFNMFVFLEISGIATYALIASGDRRPAAMAAIKYLVIGTVGATLYLIGVGYLYAATGTLNIVDIANSLAGGGSADVGILYEDPLVRTGFAFIVAGLATKVAIFPLHSWQPDAYAEAPDAISTLISALVSTVAAYALIRVTFSAFTVDFFVATPEARWVLIGLGTVSILVGSGLAVIQRRVKRMLAYSSVAQFGMVVAAIGLATGPIPSEYALAGAIIHLIGHGVMKGGLFAAAGGIAQATGARTVAEYAELGRHRPVLAASIGLLGFALVGVPPSLGFVGKWYIAIGAVETGVWLVAVVIFLSTLLTLSYIARLLERLYFVPRSGLSAVPVTDGGQSVTIGIVAVVVIAALVAFTAGLLGGSFFDAVTPFLQEVLVQ